MLAFVAVMMLVVKVTADDRIRAQGMAILCAPAEHDILKGSASDSKDNSKSVTVRFNDILNEIGFDKALLLFGSNCTKTSLRTTIAELSIEADQHLLFYFNGKGVLKPLYGLASEPDNLQEYLVPYNADYNNREHLISDAELLSWLQNKKYLSLTVILDVPYDTDANPFWTSEDGLENIVLFDRASVNMRHSKALNIMTEAMTEGLTKYIADGKLSGQSFGPDEICRALKLDNVSGDREKCYWGAINTSQSPYHYYRESLWDVDLDKRGSIAVETRTPNATVFVDAIKRCITPCIIETTSGSHRLELYDSQSDDMISDEVTISPERRNTIYHDFGKSLRSSLSLFRLGAGIRGQNGDRGSIWGLVTEGLLYEYYWSEQTSIAPNGMWFSLSEIVSDVSTNYLAGISYKMGRNYWRIMLGTSWRETRYVGRRDTEFGVFERNNEYRFPLKIYVRGRPTQRVETDLRLTWVPGFESSWGGDIRGVEIGLSLFMITGGLGSYDREYDLPEASPVFLDTELG
ncbi:hypothetical protein KKH18_08630 [bacterium]|nr:hypothetical protein [bacterium]